MILRVLVPFLVLLAVAPAAAAQRPTDPPRRVVLIVADGAGLAQWSAARIAGHELAVDDFPVVGLVDSRNLTGPEPESASAATAFATGIRTYRRAIGVGPDSLPRRSIVESAERAGLATGLVTTTDIYDATPAAFVAHVVNRDLVQDIARQMTESGVDVLMGDGGWAFGPELRADRRDLAAVLARTHTVVRDPAALAGVRSAPTRGLVGFFALDSVLDPALRRPSLEEMGRTALAVLDRNPRGFFLLLENERTDDAGHHHVPMRTLVDEVLEVDRAVRAALAYRRRRPDTLVVVAGDHETGGLAIVPDGDGYRAEWSSTDHTATLVPIFAVGPGAERFGGVHSAPEIGRELFAALGLPPPDDAAVARDR